MSKQYPDDLKSCPFCGAKAYEDSCDRLIWIGCDKCDYHMHFHGVVQTEIKTPVVAGYYKGQPTEWYDKDAHEKAHKKWNRRVNERKAKHN